MEIERFERVGRKEGRIVRGIGAGLIRDLVLIRRRERVVRRLSLRGPLSTILRLGCRKPWHEHRRVDSERLERGGGLGGRGRAEIGVRGEYSEY
jgi:hypothetical protein